MRPTLSRARRFYAHGGVRARVSSWTVRLRVRAAALSTPDLRAALGSQAELLHFSTGRAAGARASGHSWVPALREHAALEVAVGHEISVLVKHEDLSPGGLIEWRASEGTVMVRS